MVDLDTESEDNFVVGLFVGSRNCIVVGVDKDDYPADTHLVDHLDCIHHKAVLVLEVDSKILLAEVGNYVDRVDFDCFDKFFDMEIVICYRIFFLLQGIEGYLGNMAVAVDSSLLLHKECLILELSLIHFLNVLHLILMRLSFAFKHKEEFLGFVKSD